MSDHGVTTGGDPKVLLEVRDLQVGYRGRALLPPLTFRIRAGEFWGLVGANGSGKTTMLRTLLGLHPPVSGRVHRGPDVRLSYIPQRSDSEDRFPGRVLDVVGDGLDRGWSFLVPFGSWRGSGRIRRSLESVGAWNWRRVPLAHLSEGQRQRVEVATALVSDPDLLVLDEPTAAMDPAAEHEVFDLLEDLVRHRGVAVLVVSHHLGLLLEHVSHLVVLDRTSGNAEVGERGRVLGSPTMRSLLPEGTQGPGPARTRTDGRGT